MTGENLYEIHEIIEVFAPRPGIPESMWRECVRFEAMIVYSFDHERLVWETTLISYVCHIAKYNTIQGILDSIFAFSFCMFSRLPD